MPNTEPVRVIIFNQTYSLVATGDSAQVQEIAQRVDQLMTEIAARAGNVDSTRTAVLACLHLADQLRTIEQELASLKGRVEEKAREFSLMLDSAIAQE
ncbi:MAG: cell division protein ZapA [Acidobacteriota bacterium]|nr:cell division protein ZapA [Acidobacteriota bacterium]